MTDIDLKKKPNSKLIEKNLIDCLKANDLNELKQIIDKIYLLSIFAVDRVVKVALHLPISFSNRKEMRYLIGKQIHIMNVRDERKMKGDYRVGIGIKMNNGRGRVT